MSKEAKFRLELTPISPFTVRQREIIELIVDGRSQNEIGEELGISLDTVKNTIADTTDYSIYGRTEKITGSRPYNRNDLIRILLNDVLLIKTSD